MNQRYMFFFNDTATTEIYTLSLHDALPICISGRNRAERHPRAGIDVRNNHRVVDIAAERDRERRRRKTVVDRKSTRLNSSHANISYAVFCLKNKKNNHLVCGISVRVNSDAN